MNHIIQYELIVNNDVLEKAIPVFDNMYQTVDGTWKEWTGDFDEAFIDADQNSKVLIQSYKDWLEKTGGEGGNPSAGEDGLYWRMCVFRMQCSPADQAALWSDTFERNGVCCMRKAGAGGGSRGENLWKRRIRGGIVTIISKKSINFRTS